MSSTIWIQSDQLGPVRPAPCDPALSRENPINRMAKPGRCVCVRRRPDGTGHRESRVSAARVMTDPRVIRGIFGLRQGCPKRTGASSGRLRPSECPRCGRSRTYRSGRVRCAWFERTDADGYHARTWSCVPIPGCPVWLHGSGPRAPLAGRPHDEYTRRAALEALLASIRRGGHRDLQPHLRSFRGSGRGPVKVAG